MGFITQFSMIDETTGLTIPEGAYCSIGNGMIYISRDDKASPPIYTIGAAFTWYSSEEHRFSGKSPIKTIFHKVQVPMIENNPYHILYESYSETIHTPVLHI